ncbi:MAG: hypothetical protein ACJ76F_08090, partial [Bacteroidia bacterium]
MIQFLYSSISRIRPALKALFLTLIFSAGFLNDLSASTFYWVNGSGSWNSYTSHWATASGGNTFYTHAPTSVDDVVFDLNSFTASGQSVKLDSGNFICHSMIWNGVNFLPSMTTNNPSGSTLKIYGSLVSSPLMKWLYNGALSFESTTIGNLVTFPASPFKLNTVTFNGTGGEWIFQNSLSCTGFYLKKGIVRTNNYNVNSSNIFQTVSGYKSLFLGTSGITSDTVNIAAPVTTLDADSVIITTTTDAELRLPSGKTYGTLNLTRGTYQFYCANSTFKNVVCDNYIELPSTSGGNNFKRFVCSIWGYITSYATNTYGYLEITSDCRLYANNTYDSLVLSNETAVSSVYFGANTNQTITGAMITNSHSCSGNFWIESSTYAAKANIIKTSGTVVLHNVVFQNINATGGATFIANDSYLSPTPGTSTTGWTINNPTPKTLYWVGGSGNWTDVNHWSLSSGGVGGACAGSKLDDVVFDSNSFTAANQEVMLDQQSTQCKNMTWSGIQYPISFNSATPYHAISIFGDFSLDPNVMWNFPGRISFRSTTPGKTINTKGVKLSSSIDMYAQGGTWALADSLHCEGISVGGVLITNGNNITCDKDFWAGPYDGTNYCRIYLGISHIRCEGKITVNPLSLYSDSASFTTRYLNLPTNKTYNSATILGGQVNFELASTLANTNNHYKKLTILGDVIITGSNIYDTLLLDNLGKTLTLTSGTTQTITSVVQSSSSSCSDYITIRSGTSGSQANIVKTTDSVLCNYLILQDINASGGAVFQSDNSIITSNVSGWTINSSPVAKTLYWVGGSGNWTDVSHWSLSSGGSGGACIPIQLDDVIFDLYSFNASNQQVNANVANIYCRNLTWQTNPFAATFANNVNSSLNIFGSCSIAQNMSWNYTGTLVFRSGSSGNTLETTSHKFNTLVFEGNGSWSLQDSVRTSHLIINKGSLVTNNNNISCDYLFSANTGYSNLYLGTSKIRSLKIRPDYWNPSGIIIQLPLGTLDADSAGFTACIIQLPPGKSYGDVEMIPLDGAVLNEKITVSNSSFRSFSTSPSFILFGSGNSFKKFTINGNATIQGSHTYDSLILNNPGKFVLFDDYSIHTINNGIISASSCASGFITLKNGSASSGWANIKKTSGSVTLQALTLQNIHAFGGASFTANNSIAIGSVTGWAITSSTTPRTLYWVGGSGNWSYNLHWASTSGGNGGSCPPTSIDDVIFDENSFSDTGQVVTIDLTDVSCNNMSWVNQQYSPSVACDFYPHYVNIYGNFLMDPTVKWKFTGRLSFKSTSAGKNITAPGVDLGSVSLDGTGGWILQDSIHCKYLAINHGTLNSNNKRIYCDNLFQVNSGYNGLYLGTSEVYAPDGLTFQASSTAVLDADSSSLISNVVQLPTGKLFNQITIVPCSGTMTSSVGDTLPCPALASLTATSCTIKLISGNTSMGFYGSGNTVGKLKVYQDLSVGSSNTYDSLYLYNPGKTITLASSTTQTISGNILNSANCTTGITSINSGISGMQATIVKTSGAVTLNALVLKDIKAMGGAVFTANNSTAVSGVTGWTINNPSVTAPGATGPISGLSNVCAYVGTTGTVTYSIDSVPGISLYNWTVPAGSTVVSGQGTTAINVNYTSSFVSGNVAVQSVSGCGGYPSYSAFKTLAIIKTVPAIPGVISGPTNACLYINSGNNVTYSVSPVTGATTYNWVVPAGATLVSGQGTNTITVSYQSTFVSGNVSVQSVSACGSSLAKTLAITKTLAAIPVAITGAANVCQYMGTSSNVTYSIAAAASANSYSWAVPAGATIVSGQGTTSIDVNYSGSFVSGNVSVQSVSGCGSSSAKTLAITKTIPASPLAITGASNACQYIGTSSNATYSITAVATATSYNWTVPAGATLVSGQGTTSIDVSYSGSFVSGNITVQSVSGCGSSIAKALAITKTLPLAPTVIS